MAQRFGGSRCRMCSPPPDPVHLFRRNLPPYTERTRRGQLLMDTNWPAFDPGRRNCNVLTEGVGSVTKGVKREPEGSPTGRPGGEGGVSIPVPARYGRCSGLRLLWEAVPTQIPKAANEDQAGRTARHRASLATTTNQEAAPSCPPAPIVHLGCYALDHLGLCVPRLGELMAGPIG